MMHRSLQSPNFCWRPGWVESESHLSYADIPLSPHLLSALRQNDVDVMVSMSLFAPDQDLHPRLQYDVGFGFKDHLGIQLEMPTPSSITPVTLPKGTLKLRLRPHSGAFFARQMLLAIEPAQTGVKPRKSTKRIFAARFTDAATQPHHAQRIGTGNIDLDPNGSFRSTSNDPSVSFMLHTPLRAGWYRIEARLKIGQNSVPKMYFWTQRGYLDAQACSLVAQKENLYTGLFHLAEDVSTVRFDPTNRHEDGTLDSLDIHPLGRLPRSSLLLKPVVWQNLFSGINWRIMLARTRGRGNHEGAWSLPTQPQRSHEVSYDPAARFSKWIEQSDFRLARDKPAYCQKLDVLEHKPVISILTPVYNTPIRLLDEMIKSVQEQIYENWELCLADDASTEGNVAARLDYWAGKDSRIKVVHRKTNGNISAATNSAFEIATGDWLAMLDHDDVLRPHALAEIALAIAEHPDANLIYSDEDKIDDEGNRYEPYFKPDYSPLMFLGQNYFNHLTVHRAEQVRAAGGWRLGYEGSQDYDLNLRILERIPPESVIHIPKILYHWRATEGSTALATSEKSYAFDAGLKALQNHLDKRHPGAVAKQAGELAIYRVEWPIPEKQPLVSLIVPTRDYADLVKMCVTSIQEKTTYENYEILIIDNQSTDPDALDLFAKLAKDPRIRVLRYDKPFNYSAINNFAVPHARGDIIGLVNNDIEVISPHWLDEMVSLALQPDIGCVGAKLYYPDDTIQHAGVILGIGGVAGHSHKYAPREHQGYFSRLMMAQDLSAVTAACLLMRREVYQEVDGLNESELAVAFNDVDLCLRVRAAGYRNVWTPRAELYHHESISRGHEITAAKQQRFQGEIEYMVRTWDSLNFIDPFYSPHLSRTVEDFRIGIAE